MILFTVSLSFLLISHLPVKPFVPWYISMSMKSDWHSIFVQGGQTNIEKVIATSKESFVSMRRGLALDRSRRPLFMWRYCRLCPQEATGSHASPFLLLLLKIGSSWQNPLNINQVPVLRMSELGGTNDEFLFFSCLILSS